MSQTETTRLKLYSPLFCKVYERDYYGNLDEHPINISPADAVQYEDDILAALARENSTFETYKGMMQYYDENDGVREKVLSAMPAIENVDGELYGVLVCDITETLSQDELATLIDWWRGQSSDGFGEGFEQRDIEIEDEAILNVSFWDCSNEYWLKIEDEFKQSQEGGLCQIT